jgi:hypothetical protein
MSEGISFNSKIDTWLLVVLLTGVAGCLLAALYLIQGATGMRIVAGLLFLVAALIVWPLVTTRYVLSDAQLRIRCGPITWTVPVTEITAVTPTRNPLSSPALSLDRIRIDYGKGRSIMLAPEPREAFLRQLQARRV